MVLIKIFFCWQPCDMSLFELFMCFEVGLWLFDVILMKSDFKSHHLALQRKIFHTLSALVTPSGKPKDTTVHTRFRTSPPSLLYQERSLKEGSALKRAILYLLSLCPMTFKCPLKGREKEIKKEITGWPRNF